VPTDQPSRLRAACTPPFLLKGLEQRDTYPGRACAYKQRSKGVAGRGPCSRRNQGRSSFPQFDHSSEIIVNRIRIGQSLTGVNLFIVWIHRKHALAPVVKPAFAELSHCIGVRECRGWFSVGERYNRLRLLVRSRPQPSGIFTSISSNSSIFVKG